MRIGQGQGAMGRHPLSRDRLSGQHHPVLTSLVQHRDFASIFLLRFHDPRWRRHAMLPPIAMAICPNLGNIFQERTASNTRDPKPGRYKEGLGVQTVRRRKLGQVPASAATTADCSSHGIPKTKRARHFQRPGSNYGQGGRKHRSTYQAETSYPRRKSLFSRTLPWMDFPSFKMTARMRRIAMIVCVACWPSQPVRTGITKLEML